MYACNTCIWKKDNNFSRVIADKNTKININSKGGKENEA